jgi:methyltransferase-like protein/SAM-dependent methyltransferase
MSTPSAAANPYDQLPYPSEPLAQSHPDRLAAVATLFGMQPPRADRARVMEIGCSTGGNLIPMAERHAESSFVGIDYSQVQIAAAQRVADALGLRNLELRRADIAELSDELGKFDYIIAHGVYSWVPRALEDKLLALCGSLLSEQGVALVSYNVLPGWHQRLLIRDVLWRHAPPGAPMSERLARGREVLEFFSTTLGQQQAAASRLLKQIVDVVLRQPDHYIWHEYFEPENHPLYFHEFVERAAPFGLQYLGDAALPTMFASSFGPHLDEQVRRIAGDVISAEQHVDLARNRAFRQTLLCRKEVRLSRHLSPDRLEKLYIAAPLRPANPRPELASAAMESFLQPDGRAVSSPDPTMKAALYVLAAAWPRAVSIDELLAQAARLLGTGGAVAALSAKQRQDLGHNLVQCVANGIADATSLPDSFVTAVSARPLASRLARLQGGHSKTVTSRRHQSVTLDDATRHLLQYLDGQHDHQALVAELIAAIDRGHVSILVDGVPATRGRDVSEALTQSLERSLVMLAANALLVA